MLQPNRYFLFVTYALALLLSGAPVNAQAAADAQRDYDLGLAAYNRGNYQRAVEYFQSSLAKDPKAKGNCIRRLYLGHSYAGLKELGKAIRVYHEIEGNCWGSPEAKLATQCIEKLSNPDVARAVVASTSQATTSSLMSRVKIIAPRHSRVSINPDFISKMKSTIGDFRGDLYQALDKGGCTITIAQTILDKWPDSQDFSKSAGEHMKLSQDYGQTQGRDIYVWERPISAEKVVGEPFPTWCIQSFLRTQMARVACHLQGIDEDKEYLALYKKDVDKLTNEDKQKSATQYIAYLSKQGPSQLAGYIVENYLTSEVDQELSKAFPQSYAWIKKRLKL